MNLILIAAVVAVCGAAKLDRNYLPPVSAKTAGGSPGSLQTPFAGNSFNEGASNLPKGSFTNEFQGVVVDAAAAGTRASGEGETGLGGPRVSYGSTDSRVGEAAFRDAPNFRPFPGQDSAESQSQQSDSQTAGASQDFNQNRFNSFGESKPERAQAAFDRVANTLRFENEVGPESYHYAYETDNGISAEENGLAINGVQAQGGFSYTGDDGKVYSVSYIADEGGYQPRGDHLPTPPPIPEEILKALEKNAQDEAAGVIDDGSYDAQKYNAGDYAESDSGNTDHSDRQSPIFGKQPESDATASGTFINQNNQAFGPNTNALPGQRDSSKDSQSSVNDFGSVENFGQTSQPGRGNSNNFGSRKEYLPPTNGFNQNGRVQRPFTPTGTNAPQSNQFADSRPTFASSGNGEAQNYQGTQSSSNFARPGSNRLDVLAQSASKENSQEKNDFAPSSNNNFGQSAQTSQNSGSSLGSRTEYLPPVNRFGQNGRTPTLRPQRPTASAEATSTASFNAFSQNTGSFQSNNEDGQSSSSGLVSGTADRFSGFQQRPQSFNNQYSQNRFQASQNGQSQNQGDDVSSDASFGAINSQRPTSQPSTELTTPFESNEQPQSTSSPSTSFNAFNSPTNSRPASQYSQNNGQFPSSSRPQNRPSQSQGSSFSSQGQFNRPSFTSNQISSEGSLNENVRDINDAQFSPSTVRPTFGQAQGQDDSYYYRQPSKAFNTPSGSRFPGASSGQFDSVNQQTLQGPSQFSGESQKNSFQSQNIKYPEPPTVPTAAPTVSFEQFQGSTPASQYTEASISPFQSINQATTKYPRPPTVPTASPFQPLNQATTNSGSYPTIPTAAPSQYNGNLQTTASSFASAPTGSFGSRPSYQQPAQSNYQSQPQGSSQFSQTVGSSQDAAKDDSEPQVATQQYNGEIYEYSKPAQSLPAPAQKQTTSGVQQGQNRIPESQPTRSQFDATQGSSNVQEYTQQPARPTFGARPQFGSQTRPQFGQFNSQEQPTQESRPQSNAQSSFEGSQENQKPAQSNRSKCCQSLDSRLQSFRGTQGNQGQFGSQFPGSPSQTVSQNTGRGEVFGGPRKPPSFDQETGYHY
ncbi:mucin-2-like [Ostrinia nubilalis]|uniref:mucin-2-like n=1 Tax=Ostrinia nubilalis TaxID=29057 RepID=UPI00308240AC